VGARHAWPARPPAHAHDRRVGLDDLHGRVEAWAPAEEREQLIEIFETLPGIERVRIEPLG
jgi:hypothetical protein